MSVRETSYRGALGRFLVVALLSALTASGCFSSGNSDPDDSDPDPPSGEHVFYAHSDKVLYKIDPRTNDLSEVGAFGGDFDANNDQATDIAVNAAGEVYITTYHKIMKVDPETAQATFVTTLSQGSMAVALTFLPVDMDDPTGPERLVGGAGTTLSEIDTTNGSVTVIGDLGVAFAGDLFYVRGVGIYATVSGNPSSQLARLDESTFAATPIGPTGFNNVWGLAYYGGTFYGFNYDYSTPPYGGYMFTIDVNTGVGTLVESFEGATFYGAGVTTVAPNVPIS